MNSGGNRVFPSVASLVTGRNVHLSGEVIRVGHESARLCLARRFLLRCGAASVWSVAATELFETTSMHRESLRHLSSPCTELAAFLPGWFESDFCRVEEEAAMLCGLRRIYLSAECLEVGSSAEGFVLTSRSPGGVYVASMASLSPLASMP